MKKYRNCVLAGAAALLLSLTGCTAEIQESEMQICLIGKSADEYWEMVRAGAREAGEEMGIDIVYKAPECEEDIDVQIEMIDQAVSCGAQAIIVAPLDADALNESLARADNAGIPVLTIDSDVSYEGTKSCISTHNASAGALAARQAAAFINENGKIAVIAHSDTSQTARERTEGFVHELEGGVSAQEGSSNAITAESTSGYPDIEIVEISNSGGDIQRSREAAVQIIKEEPDLKLIYATNQTATIGACQAIRELGVQNQVTLIGFDYFSGAEESITSGVLDGVIVQNPYNMGYLGVRYARNLVQGENVAPRVDTGAILVTAENLNDQTIRFLVNPTGE